MLGLLSLNNIIHNDWMQDKRQRQLLCVIGACWGQELKSLAAEGPPARSAPVFLPERRPGFSAFLHFSRVASHSPGGGCSFFRRPGSVL